MQLIRVLHIVSAMQRGGVETLIMNLYRNINRNKIQFDFIVHGNIIGHYEIEIKELGGIIYHVTPKKDNFIKNIKEVENIIKVNNYKIVHVHQDAMSMFALKAAYKSGAEVRIAHAHSTSMPPSVIGKIIYFYAIRNICKYLTHKFSCSIESAKYLFNNNIEDVIYINNGVETSKFMYNESKRQNIRNTYEWNNKFIVGHIGNFLYPKNHMFVIEIFLKILEKESNAELILCGTGEMMDLIVEQTIKFNIQNKVSFMGNVSNIYELMQGMDCAILPSFYEGFPVVTVEAQCSDLPIFVSDNITKETQITNAISYISLQDSSKKWADIILEKSSSYKRQNMSDVIIDSGFDISNIAKKLENLYLTV